MPIRSPSEYCIEIGARQSRLVRGLILLTIGAFLLQLFFYRINPSQKGPYFVPWSRVASAETLHVAPEPLTQLFWLSAPDALGRLWLWQFVTYPFMHSAVALWHLLIGLLGLWMFGPEVVQRMGPRKFIVLYLGTAIVCGIASVLVTPSRPMLGCLGAVLAVAGAFVYYFPTNTAYIAFFPIKARNLVFLFWITATVVCIGYTPDEFHIVYWAHPFGLPLGWILCRADERLDRWIILWELRRHERRLAKERAMREKVDALLEKVNRVGIENLSRWEIAFLRHASRKFRQWREADKQLD